MSVQIQRKSVNRKSQRDYRRLKHHPLLDDSFILSFDTETTIDFSQTMRFGVFCFGKIGSTEIERRGFITGHLENGEEELLKEYAQKINARIYTRNEFVTRVFYPSLMKGYHVAGHNLAFDSARLMTVDETDDPFEMETNGKKVKIYPDEWRMKICDCPETSEDCKKDHPRILIRSISTAKRIYSLDLNSGYTGSILDTQTIGTALLGPVRSSLENLCNLFGVTDGKLKDARHGEYLTNEYIDYAVRDSEATLSLLRKEKQLYDRHGLNTHLSKIVSVASIGKNYLVKAGLKPFNQQFSMIPDWFDKFAYEESFFGARAEVRIRLKKEEIIYSDFKSQYPTGQSLIGLQDDWSSESLNVEFCTDEIKKLIEEIDLEWLQIKSNWRKLKVLVQIDPNGDVLPYRDKNFYGLARINKSSHYIYRTLCDVIASKLITGKTPKIVNAVRLIPEGRQETTPLMIFGDKRFTIDLSKEDFFVRLIDLRSDVKKEMKKAKTEGKTNEAKRLKEIENALKLIANATSYGVMVETREVNRLDEAGNFYLASLGCHITGSSRLLLAIAQTLGKQNGIQYAMCDTDSMAFAKPEEMTREEFQNRVTKICDWFLSLNPYRDKDHSILETEDVNKGIRIKKDQSEDAQTLNYLEYDLTDDLETLYFLGVSAKRYVIYNLTKDGKPIIRKMSAHGAGSYAFDNDFQSFGINFVDTTADIEPTDKSELSYLETDCEISFDDLPTDVLKPLDGVTQGKLWLYMIWYRAIEQLEANKRLTVPNEQWTQALCKRQRTISKPIKLNTSKYIPNLRAFNFYSELSNKSKSKIGYDAPKANNDRELLKGSIHEKKTFKTIDKPEIKTLREAFKDFFTHAERKAANGSQTGLMDIREIEIEGSIRRTRKGKKTEEAMLENIE